MVKCIIAHKKQQIFLNLMLQFYWNNVPLHAQKRYISYPCSESPNDAIFTTFGTVVDLTYVMTSAHFVCYQLKGEHSMAVHNLPFSHDLNGWPYNRQALTCCRDAAELCDNLAKS